MFPYETQSTCISVLLPASVRPTTQCYCITQDLVMCPAWPLPGASSAMRYDLGCWGLHPVRAPGLQEGVSPVPTALMGKNLFISHLSDLAQPLHTVSPSSTGIASRWAEPQCSCLSCVCVLFFRSSLCPGPSERNIKIRWSITILLAVTKFFRTWWLLLKAKAWRTYSIFLSECSSR